MEIVFRSLAPWAVLPHPIAPDAPAPASQANAEGFRWLRQSPARVLNSPWKTAEQTGWLVPSPVAFRLAPSQQAEVCVPNDQQASFGQAIGMPELWPGTMDRLLVADGTQALHASTVRHKEDWRTLLFPSGLGFVEFRLGWTARIPLGSYLLLAPLPAQDDIEVTPGLLAAKTLKRLSADMGIAIVFRPKRALEIRRHQPIARLFLIHIDSLRAKSRIEPATIGDDEPEPIPDIP